MFKGTVDNHVSLPAVQNLYYLKGALRGEAMNVLAHLHTANANYSVALNLLQGRYEKQCMITGAQFVYRDRDGAEALGIGSTECDFLWIHYLSEKLDTMTARELQLSN